MSAMKYLKKSARIAEETIKNKSRRLIAVKHILTKILFLLPLLIFLSPGASAADDDVKDLMKLAVLGGIIAGGEAAGGMTSGSGSNFMRNLSMYCESIQMPGQNIRSVEDPLRFGPQREQAQGVTYGSVNARFICSRDLREKLFFEAWQSLIFNHDTWEMKFYKDYIGGLKIYQEDRSNNSTYGVELMEVFPKVVQQQELGWNINDAYQTISVELMFHSWEIADADPAGPMGGMTSPTAPNVVEGEVDATG